MEKPQGIYIGKREAESILIETSEGTYLKKVETKDMPCFAYLEGKRFMIRTIDTSGNLTESQSDPRYFCEDNYLAEPEEVREIIRKYRKSGEILLRRAKFLEGALEQLAESGPKVKDENEQQQT